MHNNNIGAAKLENNYRSQRRLQLEPKFESRSKLRVPKLGRHLRTAIRTVLEVLPQAKHYHAPTSTISGSECISGENSKIWF